MSQSLVHLAFATTVMSMSLQSAAATTKLSRQLPFRHAGVHLRAPAQVMNQGSELDSISLPAIDLNAEIVGVLQDQRLGKDNMIQQADLILPAKSLNQAISLEARQEEIETRIATEVSAVSMAFDQAATSMPLALGDTPATSLDSIRLALKTAIAQFDPESARDGAARIFEGPGPSLSVMRQVIVMSVGNVSSNSTVSVENVFKAISAFENTPKPSDHYYRYLEARSLAIGYQAVQGDDIDYLKLPEGPMPLAASPLAIKKCRKVFFSWYCSTNLFTQQTLNDSETKLMSIHLMNLPSVGDHPDFARSDKGKNIVDGYTGIYLVRRTGSTILIYNLGIQDKASSAGSFTSQINAGHKLEYRQLKLFLQSKFPNSIVM